METKTVLTGMAILAMALTVFAIPPAADNGLDKGKSDVLHLYLFEKDAGWNIVDGGAWGKMTYDTGSGKLVFNGHGLEADTGYSLVNYGGWSSVQCLGDTTESDVEGNTHVGGNVAYGDMIPSVGKKIWLVKSSDVNCETGTMTAWHTTEYLFEYTLI